jgi:hypothetical protein
LFAHRWRLINERHEDSGFIPVVEPHFFSEGSMEVQTGYMYHIKDSFFTLIADPTLMRNKENGHSRPVYFCLKDEKTSLLWMVPVSSRIDKYRKIFEKQTKRYGRCLTIVLGEYDGKAAAFLLQNMFPMTETYVDHVHTNNGNPGPVNHDLQQEITTKMKQLLHIIAKNKKVVFTDIPHIEACLRAEKQIAGAGAAECG